MPRRVSLPAADELFRTTGGSAAVQPSNPNEPAQPPAENPAPAAPGGGGGDTGAPAAVPGQGKRRSPPQQPPAGSAGAAGAGAAAPAAGQPQPRKGRAARRPSGRERHDEKITVYVSAEELMDLEHARLVLRGEHGLAVDRGRIVREAVAVVLADLESRGDASILVRRLRGR
ncbi:hypothetical protein MTQ13_07095 [Streptomyces sp. XM4011]|nr:hypothetical protein [Streptomyces sp. XM4011]MCK1814041.1 hypothetical protein [Streptomyces sp. XM4011]